jgi:hypothetical protein
MEYNETSEGDSGLWNILVLDQRVPVSLTCMILTFPAINSGKMERTMDIRNRVSEVEEPMEWKELVALSISLGCGGKAT